MGTRLGSAFATNVKRNQLVGRLRPVFAHYREARLANEMFGDFCHRVGMDALRELSRMAVA